MQWCGVRLSAYGHDRQNSSSPSLFIRSFANDPPQRPQPARVPFGTGSLATVFVRAAYADVIMDWNAKGDAIAAEKQILLQTRVMSMLHIAMFEAVNAIERRYAPYKLALSADRSTSKEAAAATAAHDVLLSIYPDQKAALETALAASLSGIPETDAKVKGIALGKEAAEGMIMLRAKDGVYPPRPAAPIDPNAPCAANHALAAAGNRGGAQYL